MKSFRFPSSGFVAFCAILGCVNAPKLALAQRPLGVDASNHQGPSVNWSSVHSANIVFAWTKATEDTDFIDADFTRNMDMGKAAGIYMGGYHFAHPADSSPSSQANYFWNEAGSRILADGLSLMPMLDYEVFTGVTGASSYADWANQWCNMIVSDAIGVGVSIKPAIYISACNAGNLDSSVSQWINDIANYNGENPQTGTAWSTCVSDNVWGGTSWNVWQYNDTASLAGFPSEQPDVDVFNGTTNTLFTTMVATATTNTGTGPGLTLYWDPTFKNATPGSGGTGTWNTTTTNWWRSGKGDVNYYSGGDYAVFAGPAGTITLGTSLNAQGLSFSNAGYTINGSTTLTLTGTAPVINVPPGGVTTINCILNGSGYEVSGGGILLLSNAANANGSSSSAQYVTGPNTTLVVNTDHDVGSSGIALNLQNGGIYQDNDTVSGDQFLLPGSAIALLAGGGIFDNPNANLSMTNFVTGPGSLTIIGTTFTLTMTDTGNNYTGGTIIQSGTLKANAQGVLGSATAPLTASGGTLDLNATSQTFGTVTISGGKIQNGTVTGTSYAGQSGTVSGVLAGAVAMTKTTTGTLTLSGANTYSGSTTISAGTLTLASTGSINSSPSISIAAGGTLDVSAIASYTLSSSTTLAAGGTATTANIKGGTTVSLGSRPITLNYDGSHPALTISQGTLSLNGNAFTVNGTKLAAGVYTLIQQTTGNITSAGTYTVAGTAIGAAGTSAAVSVSGGTVVLTIINTTTTTLAALTNSTYGQPVTIKATVAPTPAGGTVQFVDNGLLLGNPVSVVGGVATFTTSTLAVGTHPLTAAYGGTTGYGASATMNASNQVVSAAALSVTATPQTKVYGTSLNFGSGNTNFAATNLQNGETIGSVTLAVGNNGGAANAPVGTYTITPSAATGGTFTPANYSIAYHTGTLTVTLPSNTIPVTITGVTPLANGTMQLNFAGTPGYVYMIEAASNLTVPVSWTMLSTNAADTNGAFSFNDLSATNYSGRYYRTATQ